MRVLVLGATGFVGQAVIRHLLRTRGTEIIAAGRRWPAGNADQGVDYRVFDGTDAAALLEAATGVSHIVNCVMGPGDTMAKTTGNVCEAAVRAGVERVVHFSSSAVYGATTGLITESTPITHGTDWYSAAKVACEATVATAMRSFHYYGHPSGGKSERSIIREPLNMPHAGCGKIWRLLCCAPRRTCSEVP